ncbi:uncharacterized protein HKW66_Vig0005440 [Vigna angularis]|uniref:Uncharacterized protein n=1 Tax=Phaseolus angularis TaxID=3914 RepID=A0A8T0LCF6_PHAAN|nr:uncharacterized protein HKW66_Vig0005440 [Vigna angularis]
MVGCAGYENDVKPFRLTVLPSPTATVIGTSSLSSDTSIFSNLPADSKGDPRRRFRKGLEITEADTSFGPSVSSTDLREEDPSSVNMSDETEAIGTDSSSISEFDQFSLDVQVEPTLEDTCLELPQLPPYVELSKEQRRIVKNMVVRHIINSYKHLHGTYCQEFWMPLLARLVAQIDDDEEFIMMLQKHILEDHWIKSSLKILNDLCYSDVIGHDGKVIRDIERVTQGLGAIWSLILGRPQNRQACLGIALKVGYEEEDMQCDACK